MRVLVCGVGYIGSCLVEALLERGNQLVVLDNLFSTDPAVFERLGRESGCRLIRGSTSDPAAVAAALSAGPSPDVVFLAAAQSSGHPDAAPPEYTEETNLRGPRVVLDAAIARGVPRIVYASSMRVYGPTLTSTVDEASPYGPLLDLAHLSHVYGEKLLELYAHRYGLAAVAVRIGLVYGLAPVMKSDSARMTAPNKFCLQAARGEEARVTAGGEGFHGLIHARDAARALLASVDLAEPDRFVAANAVAEVATMREVADLVAALARGRSPPPPTASPRPSVGSRLDARGFRPSRQLVEGLAEVLAHFRRQCG